MIGRCDGWMGLTRSALVLQFADDHHAFHEDAKPGDLSLQLDTRPFNSFEFVGALLSFSRFLRLAWVDHTLVNTKVSSPPPNAGLANGLCYRPLRKTLTCRWPEGVDIW